MLLKPFSNKKVLNNIKIFIKIYYCFTIEFAIYVEFILDLIILIHLNFINAHN